MTNVASMFYGCSALKNMDFNNFPEFDFNDCPEMFTGCSELIVTVSDELVEQYEGIGYDDQDAIVWFVAPHSFYEVSTITTASTIHGSATYVVTPAPNFKTFFQNPDNENKYFKNHYFDCDVGVAPPLSQFDEEVDGLWSVAQLFAGYALPVFEMKPATWENCASIYGLFQSSITIDGAFVSADMAIIFKDMNLPVCTRCAYFWDYDGTMACAPRYVDIENLYIPNTQDIDTIVCIDDTSCLGWSLRMCEFNFTGATASIRSGLWAKYSESEFLFMSDYSDEHYFFWKPSDTWLIRLRWDYWVKIKSGEVDTLAAPTLPTTTYNGYQYTFYGRDCSKLPSTFSLPEDDITASYCSTIKYMFAYATLPRAFQFKGIYRTTNYQGMFEKSEGVRALSFYIPGGINGKTGLEFDYFIKNSQIKVLQMKELGTYSGTCYQLAYGIGMDYRTVTLPTSEGDLVCTSPVYDWTNTKLNATNVDTSYWIQADTFITNSGSAYASDSNCKNIIVYSESGVDWDVLTANIDTYLPESIWE